jgi:hypothetical protein
MKRTTRKPPRSTGIKNGSRMREKRINARAKSPANTRFDHRFDTADVTGHPTLPPTAHPDGAN